MPRTYTNDELWNRLSEVGIFRDKDDGATTTLSAAAAKGAASFAVASGSSIQQDMWLRIGTASRAELVKVKSVTTNTVTPYAPLAFAHANGSEVQEVERVPLGAIGEDGVSAPEFAGDFNQVNAAQQRAAYAFLIGHTDGIMRFSVLDYNLENIALAFGLPETAIVGSGTAQAPYRLILDPDDFGQLSNHFFYFTGIRKDLTSFEVQAWRTDVNFNRAIAHQTGQAAPIQFEVHAQAFAIYTPALA